MSPRRGLAVLLGLGILASGGASLSGATYTATSANPANTLTAAADWGAPTVAVTAPSGVLRGIVTLTATASDGTGAGIASVRIQRSPADADTWTDICTDSTTPFACSLDTTVLANDDFDLRAIATDAAGNTTTSDLVGISIDNAAPTVALANPGATLSGTITLTATAADADSGVSQVTIQRSLAGLNTWSDVCVVNESPWSCRWNTATVGDGLYDLRAIAVDAAGNTRTSSTVGGRRVDNTTVSTISLEDPGAFLRGTVTLTANANALGGVASVRIQRSRAGAGSWTDICTDTTSPYTCAFATATAATPDGLYDLRAIMTSNTGATTTSATVTNRTIDNTVVRGLDVQTVNKPGGTAGRLETGDQLLLTYSEPMKAATLISGWSDTGPALLSVRLTDAGSVETITLLNAAGTAATGLGSVAPGGNYIRKNKTTTFGASALLSSSDAGGSVVTITLGAADAGHLRTQSAGLAMKWTPSAVATDLAGNPSSRAVVTESGALDRDF